MTITMTSKHQITIPQKIVNAFDLRKGALFTVEVRHNRIELIPLETTEKQFTEEEYVKMEELFQKDKHKTKKVTQNFINTLKAGKV